MPLPLTCAQLEERWAEADEALHKLRISGIARIRYGEKEVEYKKGDMAALVKYTQQLADQVAACKGLSTLRRSAITFIPV